jgi:hypothetical protein
MLGCVGVGVGAMRVGMTSAVEVGVGETAVGVGVSVGGATDCFPQAARNARRMIQKYWWGVGLIFISTHLLISR